VIGLTITFVLLLVSAVMTSSGVISETLVDVVIGIITSVGACAAGFLAVMRLKKQALLTGVITGVVFFLLLVLLGALFLKGVLPEKGIVPILVSAVLGATLGGVAGAMLRR